MSTLKSQFTMSDLEKSSSVLALCRAKQLDVQRLVDALNAEKGKGRILETGVQKESGIRTTKDGDASNSINVKYDVQHGKETIPLTVIRYIEMESKVDAKFPSRQLADFPISIREWTMKFAAAPAKSAKLAKPAKPESKAPEALKTQETPKELVPA